jgi:hypothetical protein
VSVRIRAGSKFKHFPCFVLIDVRCFTYLIKSFRIPFGVRVPQVEDEWSRKCGSLDESHQYRPSRPVKE